VPGTVEFATRVAVSLVRKCKKPVYVGCSISLAGTGLGGTVEEELEGLKRIILVLRKAVGDTDGGDGV
jgi:hypothetical protein